MNIKRRVYRTALRMEPEKNKLSCKARATMRILGKDDIMAVQVARGRADLIKRNESGRYDHKVRPHTLLRRIYLVTRLPQLFSDPPCVCWTKIILWHCKSHIIRNNEWNGTKSEWKTSGLASVSSRIEDYQQVKHVGPML